MSPHGAECGESGVAGRRHSPRDATLRIGASRAAHIFERRPPARATAHRNRPGDGGVHQRAGEELADSYSAKHLSVLEGLEAVRKRPGMYIGSTDGRGLQHCLWEIFDNSVDEALAGYCTRVEVILHADGSAEVRDNGRGIPVDNERKTKLSGVELVHDQAARGRQVRRRLLHRLRRPARSRRVRGERAVRAAGRRGGQGRPHLGGQLPPRGHRRVRRAGARPDADFSRKAGLRQIARVSKTKAGTRIRFWPDRQVFLRDATFSYDGMVERARQTAYLVPGLAIAVRAEAGAQPGPEADGDGGGDGGGPRQAEFRFAGGISEFCEHLAAGEKVTDVLRLTGDGTFTETVPVLDDRGHMTPTEVERTLDVDMAIQWNAGYDTITRSFVNVIATPHHGTHVTGFDRAIVRTLNEQLRAARILRNGDEPVTKEDILEGLTSIISVRLPEPQFEGQTKEVLGTPAATAIVSQVVRTQLKNYFENPPRGAKQQAKAVLDKVASAAKTRIAAREHRENQRRKSVARQLEPAGQAGRLPVRRRPQRAVHRRGRLRPGHRQAGQGLRVPGAAADPRQDPQRAEVEPGRHAQERRVRRHHPGPRRRLGLHVRPGLGAVPAGDPDGRRRRRRRAHPHPAAHPVPPVHARRCSKREGCSPPCPRCTGSS